MKKLFAVATVVLALALAMVIAPTPAFGQVTVGLGVFERGHDVSAAVDVSGANASFRHKSNGKSYMQDLTAGVKVTDRYNFAAGGHWHSLGTGRAFGPVAAMNGKCKLTQGFAVVYGVRGYPSMNGRVPSRGAGWSVAATKDVGPVGVHVGWDWDRFWANHGPGSVKSAGVTAGVSFRLGS